MDIGVAVAPKRMGSHGRSHSRELCHGFSSSTSFGFGSSSSLHRSSSTADVRLRLPPGAPWRLSNSRSRRLVEFGLCFGLTAWLLLAYVFTPLGAARGQMAAGGAGQAAMPLGCAGLSKPAAGGFYHPRGPQSPPAMSSSVLLPRALGTPTRLLARTTPPSARRLLGWRCCKIRAVLQRPQHLFSI